MPLKPEKRPSGIYRIRGTHHGIKVDRSARTRSIAQAREIAEAWERQIYEQEVLGRRRVETFAELAIDYMKAGRTLGVKAEEIITALGDKRADQIKQVDLEKLVAVIWPNGAAPGTVNRWLITPVSALIRWAADDDRVPYRIFKRKRVRQSKTDWRRPSEIEAIISALPSDESRALAALYVGCGLRASEAVFLDGRELAPDLSRVTVLGSVREDDEGAREKGYAGSKSGRDRTVPIPPRARELLKPVARTWAGRALLNSRGRPWADRFALRNTLLTACKRADVPAIRPHALRHTFATWHNAVHGDPIKLMSVGGWSELKLVQRYAHVADDALEGEVIRSGWAILGQADDRAKYFPNRFKRVEL